MLTAEENERLTRVGRGTPMGELVRRFWLPFLQVSDVAEPDGPPVRVTLLLDPPAIAQFLGPVNWLVLKVRVSSPDRARNAIDLVAAAVDARFGVVEHAIFGPDLVDGDYNSVNVSYKLIFHSGEFAA
jgi:hypothetical protein